MILRHVFFFAATCGVAAIASADIVVLPGEFTLHGDRSRQRLSVHRSGPDATTAASIDAADYQITSDDPQIARIEQGNIVYPVADGTTVLTVRHRDGRTTSSRVQVTGMDLPYRLSFANDVQSVLTKSGCNQGACHGALAGKGGFRLSLKGYDFESDHFTITRQTQGRRIETTDPGRSLLLTKPTGAVPHKGGIRFTNDSREYDVLATWIAQGADGPRTDEPQLLDIRVEPADALLRPGDHSQVLVSGVYDDGRVVDVTDWAQFTATDEAVASVDDDGFVTVRGSGQAAVLVWFGSRVALARMTVPFENSIATDVFATAPRRNFIDELTLDQLRTLNLPPTTRCDDAAFLRRATLDTIGRLPTSQERDAFLADDDATRRDRLIERLLSGEDYVAYWTYKWSDMLLINGTRLRPAAVKAYYEFVRNAVAENQPWDDMVHEIVTATGVSTEVGATNFYALHQSPEEMTENACQAFLGLSIGCAKCHNHPLEKWTNDQYYAMANLFSRVRVKGWGGEPRNGDGIRTLYVAQSGELIQPNRGKPQPPAALDQPPLPPDASGDRRVALADWLTSPDNPYFARAITNRVWKNFFSRGLVEQVDDLRLSNPASNEPLLAAAADHLVASGFDLKSLMRSILQSETYQRDSVPLKANSQESKYLSRYYPRRLMAEVLLDSIDQVLGTTTVFNEVAFPGADKQKTDFYPAGTRAIELYDASVASYFLQTFGRNPREITCECERSDEPSMVQVLHLSNGDTLNNKLADPSNHLTRWIDEGCTDQEILQRLFQSAFVRQPTAKEIETFTALIAQYGDDRGTALQDVAWSVLTSTEFTFNH